MAKSAVLLASSAKLFAQHWRLRSNQMSAMTGQEERHVMILIVETRIHEYHMEEPGENIMTKDKLLAIGDKYEAMISADKATDAKYR
jgi:hypothetical protein